MKSRIHELKKNNFLSVSKKSIFILAVVTFMTGLIFTGCKSNSDKEADAVENLQDASDNLDAVNKDAEQDAIKKANDEEWQTYKEEANKTIADNEVRIAELKSAMKKPGKTFDAAYAKSIDGLEEKNASLKTKISDYENNQTDWESFKREFSSDMTGLGDALKDLTVNNKK